MKLAERGQSLRGSERPLIAMIVGVAGVPASFPALAAVAALLFSASPLRAQVVQPPATTDTNVVLPAIDVSPGGAFLRAAQMMFFYLIHCEINWAYVICAPVLRGMRSFCIRHFNQGRNMAELMLLFRGLTTQVKRVNPPAY